VEIEKDTKKKVIMWSERLFIVFIHGSDEDDDGDDNDV